MKGDHVQELMLQLLMLGPTFTIIDLIETASKLGLAGHSQLRNGFVSRVSGQRYTGRALPPRELLQMTDKGRQRAQQG